MNNDAFWRLFGFIGILACCGAVFILGYSVFDWLSAVIADLRWNYRYKHRFDKPPTAKCYCKDCRLHGKDNRCNLPGVDRFTPDNGFCYEVEPMTRSEGKQC